MIEKYPSEVNSIEEEITSPWGWSAIEGKSENSATERAVDRAASKLISHLELDEVVAESSNTDKKSAIQKIFTELAFASVYDEDVLRQKQVDSALSLYEARLIDIKRSLIDHNVVCSSDAASFTYLANKVGVECYDLTVGRDDYSGAHQVNVYRLSDNSDWKVCDITQSRTFNQPIFGLPLDRYTEVIEKDGIKPRVIFDCNRMKSVSQPSVNHETDRVRETNKIPKIANKGQFYNNDMIDKMVLAAYELNSSTGSDKYKVIIHEEKKELASGTITKVTLEGDWIDSGDASEFWRYVRAL